MSTKLTGYVWDGCAASGMKLSSVAIMARLADFSNDEGVCRPSIETIARQIGAGMSTVRTAIARVRRVARVTAMRRMFISITLRSFRQRHFLNCQILTRQNLTHQNLTRQNLMRRNLAKKRVFTRQNLAGIRQ